MPFLFVKGAAPAELGRLAEALRDLRYDVVVVGKDVAREALLTVPPGDHETWCELFDARTVFVVAGDGSAAYPSSAAHKHVAVSFQPGLSLFKRADEPVAEFARRVAEEKLC